MFFNRKSYSSQRTFIFWGELPLFHFQKLFLHSYKAYCTWYWRGESWVRVAITDCIIDVQLFFFFTDSRFQLLGSTVLYVPLEALQHRPEEAIKNKYLLQRLESKSALVCLHASVLMCVCKGARAWIFADGVNREEWTVWTVHKTPYTGNYIYRDSLWFKPVSVIYTETTAEGQNKGLIQFNTAMLL